MTDPLVSIIIPCFRQGHLLRGAIDSALVQSLRNVQVVVVNDGSDDETGAVAESYASRITYVSKPNGGLCSARNAGIGAAEGRYLLFLDADDLLHPGATSWLVEGMGEREDRLALMGFRSFVQEPSDESGQDLLPRDGAEWFAKLFELDPLLAERPPGLDPERLKPLPYLIYTNFGPPHCWLSSRRMVLEAGKFDTNLTACEDWDLWLRMALAGIELVTVPRAGAYYRRYEGSMSTDVRRMLDNRTRLLLKAADQVRAQPEAARRWAPHFLQALLRVRRRYAAYGIRPAAGGEIARELARLRRLARPTVESLVRSLLDRVSGGLADRLVLSYYRRRKADLFRYYKSDID